MNQENNEEILAELRSIRRHSQYGAYFSILLVLVCIAYVSWSVRERQQAWSGGPRSPSGTPTPAFASGEVWSRISAALDEGDNQKALSIAQDFVTRRPNYYYAYETLGSAHIAMNDFTNAEAAYVRAAELYPDEGNEKMLVVIRKRLARDRATTAR